MHQKLKVSYAICVNEEVETFSKLIQKINEYKKPQDEIVVISDYSLNKEITGYKKKVDKFVTKKLYNDFASHKNIFFDICGGDYIFNIDADELPSDELLKSIHTIIKKEQSDLYWIPRLNFTIESKSFISELNAKYNYKTAYRFPDYQGRIFKNHNHLKWERNVHEHITGSKSSVKLHFGDNFYLLHQKTKQAKATSENLYATINKFKYKKDELKIICCYFNPCNYQSRYLNFIEFLNGIKKDGYNPLVIESYNTNSKYRIKNLHSNIISVESNSILWEKEFLLNIGIKHTIKNSSEKYIMWIDTDVIFTTNNWWECIMRSTEFHGVSQIFSEVVRDRFDLSNSKSCTKKSLSYLTTESKTDIDTWLSRKGEPGYGCCYKREILEKNLLYDKCIVGGGDLINLLGFLDPHLYLTKILNDRFFKGTTDSFKKTFSDWCFNNQKLENGIGYSNVKIKTLNHGSLSNRSYKSRESMIKKFNFNPKSDLITSDHSIQLLNKKLENNIKKYFISRDEDENLIPEDRLKLNKIRKSNNIDKIISKLNDNSLNTTEENKIIIAIHIFPHELKNYERIICLLSSNKEIKSNIQIETCLNLNKHTVKYNQTNQYLITKFKEINKKSKYKVIPTIKTDRYFLGVNEHRRIVINNSNDNDDIIFLDSDLYFSKDLLKYVIKSINHIKKEYVYYILTPQIIKLWDCSWDVLVNEKYINENTDFYQKCDIEDITKKIQEEPKFTKINKFKWAGGWFTTISAKLCKLIGIPDSFRGYGPDDTFMMQCSSYLKNNNFKISQFVLKGFIVGEENKADKNINQYLIHKHLRKSCERFMITEFNNFKKKIHTNIYKNNDS